MSDIHDVWSFAKDNSSMCSDGYDKKAFEHVAWWIGKYKEAKTSRTVQLRTKRFQKSE